jgi:hypothetical protein
MARVVVVVMVDLLTLPTLGLGLVVRAAARSAGAKGSTTLCDTKGRPRGCSSAPAREMANNNTII